MRKNILQFCLFFLVAILSGCDSTPVARESEHKNEPRTQIGRQIQDAKDLQSESDERNDALTRQADDLFGEE